MTVLRGCLVLVLLVSTTLLVSVPLLVIATVRLLVPLSRFRRGCSMTMLWIAERWTGMNQIVYHALLPTEWELELPSELTRQGKYLIISNHQSWVDIFVIFRTFHDRIPFVRFFLKQQIFWFPLVGLACWAMEMPFMRRYSPEYLARHPERRGLDLQRTRHACQRFSRVPVAVMIFIEGTRFTLEKHADQQSPYGHLLRPRLGGLSYVLATLGPQLTAVLDATLFYPDGEPTLWRFVSGQMRRIVVKVRQIDVPPELMNAQVTEPGPAREAFREWLHVYWLEKDRWLAQEAGRSDTSG